MSETNCGGCAGFVSSFILFRPVIWLTRPYNLGYSIFHLDAIHLGAGFERSVLAS